MVLQSQAKGEAKTPELIVIDQEEEEKSESEAESPSSPSPKKNVLDLVKVRVGLKDINEEGLFLRAEKDTLCLCSRDSSRF